MPWTRDEAARLTAPDEVHLATRRKDGSLRSPRIIWVVGDGGSRVFIRSTNGRSADWFRWAIRTGRAELTVAGKADSVVLRETDDPNDLALADAGYQEKYGRRYGSIVAHLVGPDPRAATLEVLPDTE